MIKPVKHAIVLLFILGLARFITAKDTVKKLMKNKSLSVRRMNQENIEDVIFWSRMMQILSMPLNSNEPTLRPTLHAQKSPNPTELELTTSTPTMFGFPQEERTNSPVITEIPSPIPTIASLSTSTPTMANSLPSAPPPANSTEAPSVNELISPFPTNVDTLVAVPPLSNPPISGIAPIAKDDSVTVDSGEDAFIPVLKNDVASNTSDLLIVKAITSDASNGVCAISLSLDEVVFTPNEGFTGEDSCTYEACDPVPLCDTAIVTITVS